MKTRYKLLITTGVIGVVLAVLAIGDMDYTISKALINKESVFGEVFNRYGETPALLAMLIAIAILFGGRNKQVLWRNLLGMVTCIPLMALIAYGVVFMPIRYKYEFVEGGIPNQLQPIILIGALLLLVIVGLGVRQVGNSKLKALRKHGLVILLVVLMEMILVNVVKIIWARPRMRSMESIDQFKKWYEINGPLNSEEFKSFPSGHTANGFVMIVYSLFIPKDKVRIKQWFIAFAIVWGICVALSRILLGAHFLSDVAVGGYITVLLFYVFEGVFIKRSKMS